MNLTQLLHQWVTSSQDECQLSGLSNDSRHVKAGDLFLAYPGATADGRLYISKAIQAGAVAIAYEPKHFPSGLEIPTYVPCIAILDLANQIGSIASRFYNYPTRSLSVEGVTGTNGKTTIAYQLAQAHELLGHPAAYIGTIGEGKVTALKPLLNTTPDGLHLQQLFHAYLKQGIQQVCMEVSSHALSQHRVADIDFKQAIYTNLSHDHLDYHKTMESYAAAKAELFAMSTLKWAIVNQDDSYAEQMLANCNPTCQKLTYGLKAGDVRALNCEINLTGSEFDVQSPWGNARILIKTIGLFNIYNSLAVFSSLLAQGYAFTKVVNVMAQLNASPGRMEVVSQTPCVIVDYAHTPDALENVLTTLVHIKGKKPGRIWVIFGCGGDRDRSKRPIMGEIASQYADQIVLTSDNPRTEEPLKIIEEIAEGISSQAKVLKIMERKEAIHRVLNLVDKNDIVLIAGKGHENYQQIGQERYAFSDQQVVREYYTI